MLKQDQNKSLEQLEAEHIAARKNKRPQAKRVEFHEEFVYLTPPPTEKVIVIVPGKIEIRIPIRNS